MNYQKKTNMLIVDEQFNEQLCSLLWQIPMPGNIEVIYARDPEYFHGVNIQGKFNQVGLLKVDDEFAALGCRNIRPMFINGEYSDFGYLNGLRVLEKFRGGSAVIEYFNTLRKEHTDGRANGYLFTVIENNVAAFKALTGKKKSMPETIDLGMMYPYAICLSKRRNIKQSVKDFEIVRGDKVPLEDIVDFMHKEGRKKQFFPVYTASDFGSDYTRDFDVKDFYIAMKNNIIIGLVGKWDQSNYKQHVIYKYKRHFRYLRFLINAGMSVSGFKKLPKVGNKLKIFYLSFVCIKDDNPNVLQNLLDKVFYDNKNNDYHYCMIGLHEKDRLITALKKYTKIAYPTKLFLLYWPEAKSYCDSINKYMVPYVDISTL